MIGRISATWQRVVEQWGVPVTLLDRTTGQANPVPPEVAAAPDGLLPVFLAAGDAVWRDATGNGLGVKLQRDPKSLLGYRAERVSGGTFATVMLSMLEATHQIARSDSLPVHDLVPGWSASAARNEAARWSMPSNNAMPRPGARG